MRLLRIAPESTFAIATVMAAALPPKKACARRKVPALESRAELPPTLDQLSEFFDSVCRLTIVTTVDHTTTIATTPPEQSSLTSLEVDTVDEDIWVAAGKRSAMPFFNTFEYLVIEIRTVVANMPAAQRIPDALSPNATLD